MGRRLAGWWPAALGGAFIALALYYNVAQPIWEAPEEPASVELVRYIQVHHDLPKGLPVQDASTPPSPPGQEFVQVPLYYVLVAAATGAIYLPADATWHRNPYVTWPGYPTRYAVALHRADEAWPYQGLALLVHLGRLISAIFGLIGVLATYGLIRALTDDPAIARFGSAWVALSPVVLLQSSRVSNDTTAFAFSALTLWLCALVLIRPRAPGALLLAGLSLSAAGALLGKVHTAFLVPLVAASLVAAWLRAGRGPPVSRLAAGLARAVAVLVLPLGLLGAWWWEYGRHFGGFLGDQMGAGALRVWDVIRTADWSRLSGALWEADVTWWGTAQFDALIRWPTAVYWAVALPSLALLWIGVRALAGPPNRAAYRPGARRALAFLGLASLALLYAALARNLAPSIGYVAQARFLLPIAPVVAALLGIGTARLPARLANSGPAGYLAGVLALTVATPVVLFPRINPPQIPARLVASPAEQAAAPLVGFANGVSIARIDGVPDRLVAGSSVPLAVRWRVLDPPSGDFVLSFQLTSGSGVRISGKDVTPVEDVFPPRLWQTGEVIDQSVALPVPPELAPGSYTLRARLYRWRHAGIEPIMDPIAVVSPAPASDLLIHAWRVLPDVSTIRNPRPVGARYENSLVLTGYAIQRQGSDLGISLLWQASDVISRRLVFSVQALDASGKLIAQHDAEPVGGQLPTTDWAPGETVRDDHLLHLPGSNSPPRIIVVVYDRQTLRRLPVIVGDLPAADNVDLPIPGS